MMLMPPLIRQMSRRAAFIAAIAAMTPLFFFLLPLRLYAATPLDYAADAISRHVIIEIILMPFFSDISPAMPMLPLSYLFHAAYADIAIYFAPWRHAMLIDLFHRYFMPLIIATYAITAVISLLMLITRYADACCHY